MRLIWFFITTAILTLVIGLSGIFLTVFETKKGKILGHCARIWGKCILFFNGIKYSIKGLNNLNPDGNYIFAGNHTSVLDIPLAFSGLPFWLVPIAKIELKKVLVLGWVMQTAGHIWVDRTKRDQALKSIEKAKESLKKKPRSILLFPEGTRTINGQLGQFKKGGLLLSLDTGIPIVPVAFIGTYEMLKKGSLKMTGWEIELRIGKPIDGHNYSNTSRKLLANDVREKVAELLEYSAK